MARGQGRASEEGNSAEGAGGGSGESGKVQCGCQSRVGREQGRALEFWVGVWSFTPAPRKWGVRVGSSGGHGERGSGSGRAIGWLSCSSSGRGRPGRVGAEQEGVEVALTRTGCGVRGGAPRNRLGLSRRRDPGDWGAAVGACGCRRQGWPSPRTLHVPVSLCKLSIGRTFLPRALRGLESF